MKKYEFKYIYGPVSSWRLGKSLGVDLLSPSDKICNFDCIYCQLGQASKLTVKRGVYVKSREVIKELNRLPPIKIDYITFSGRGEPSLAANLGRAIKEVKKLNIAPVAVLTNASLIYREDIGKDISLADFVIAKLDACSQQSLEEINRPDKTIKFDRIIRGIKQFKRSFRGKFALQMMFMQANKTDARGLSELAREINPCEIQINTPLRPCGAKPLSRGGISGVKKYFSGLDCITVYEVPRKKVIPLSRQDTLERRGKNSV